MRSYHLGFEPIDFLKLKFIKNKSRNLDKLPFSLLMVIINTLPLARLFCSLRLLGILYFCCPT